MDEITQSQWPVKTLLKSGVVVRPRETGCFETNHRRLSAARAENSV